MAGTSRQPLQTRGFLTSVDLVQRQTDSVNTVVGSIKRKYDQTFSHSITGNPSCLPRLITSERPLPSVPKARLKASKITTTDVSESADFGVGASDYCQRNANSLTSGSTQHPLLSLANEKYGLPESLVTNFALLGVHAIYPWQSTCLLGKGILTGEQSLVYTAPTGGGKSLVADVLLFKRVIDDPGKKPYLYCRMLRWFRKS